MIKSIRLQEKLRYMSDPKKKKNWAEDFMEDDDDDINPKIEIKSETDLGEALKIADDKLREQAERRHRENTISTPRIPNKQIMDRLNEIYDLLKQANIGTTKSQLKAPYNGYSSTLIRMEIINRGLPQDGKLKPEFVEILTLHDKIIAKGLKEELKNKPRQSRSVMRTLLANVS